MFKDIEISTNTSVSQEEMKTNTEIMYIYKYYKMNVK